MHSVVIWNEQKNLKKRIIFFKNKNQTTWSMVRIVWIPFDLLHLCTWVWIFCSFILFASLELLSGKMNISCIFIALCYAHLPQSTLFEQLAADVNNFFLISTLFGILLHFFIVSFQYQANKRIVLALIACSVLLLFACAVCEWLYLTCIQTELQMILLKIDRENILM